MVQIKRKKILKITKKSFNKVKYKGKKSFILTNLLFKQLLINVMHLSFKWRRFLKKKIYKRIKRIKLNRRFFFGKVVRKNLKIIRYFFFFFYNYSCKFLW